MLHLLRREGGGDAEVSGKQDPSAGEDRGRVLACARCQAAITSTADRLEMAGSHEHTFANPHGFVFRIGCFARAACVPAGEGSTHFAWFPGYRWRVEHCRRCGEHLGWLFQAEGKAFHGLVLDRLVEREEGQDLG